MWQRLVHRRDGRPPSGVVFGMDDHPSQCLIGRCRGTAVSFRWSRVSCFPPPSRLNRCACVAVRVPEGKFSMYETMVRPAAQAWHASEARGRDGAVRPARGARLRQLTVYRMDRDANDLYVTVAFEDKPGRACRRARCGGSPRWSGAPVVRRRSPQSARA
jgi:hypothetical protein